jgi:squalene-hopene/tetraprenyl-beta-curcumene cyclase
MIKSQSSTSQRIESSVTDLKESVSKTLKASQEYLQKTKHEDGYWWFTLEANDSINAESIFLRRYLKIKDSDFEYGVARWISHNQNQDGSWSLYHDGPGDMSSTVECYLALKLVDPKAFDSQMEKAKKYILENGGITKIRVFTRLHLAMLGLVDWKLCPEMPVGLISAPSWSPVTIYEFSTWARASIVPLLVIMDFKKSVDIGVTLDELYLEGPDKDRWTYDNVKGLLSAENIFLNIDRTLKMASKIGFNPLRKTSLKKCETYIREHLDVTEDIYPAMFYGVIALENLGYELSDESIQKGLQGLRNFEVSAHVGEKELSALPFQHPHPTKEEFSNQDHMIYQQCCVSPIWDTAWAGVAQVAAGTPANDESVLETARWLLSKQVTDVKGDWSFKNPDALPGAWAFEFENKFYPDLDDTIEVLTFLHATDLPFRELSAPFQLGVDWLISMQCQNGGFAAFDKDNDLEILNKIPFSDHGACLDPATADITGRVIEFLMNHTAHEKYAKVIEKAANFITKNQESDGSFWGRWGVNYIYGTWAALGGLCSLNREKDKMVIARAVKWLKSIQNEDGGFGESCESYAKNEYVSCPSTPSQTAWALMGLVSAGEAHSDEAKRAVWFLMDTQNEAGSWDEVHYTGTGFPGHFYIRYHGYRAYFPQLALAKWKFSQF